MHCLDPDAARSATGTLALAALLAIPSFACSGGGAHAGRAARLDDLPRLVADEQIRIGDRDDPDTGFTFIGGVDVDRDGTVYVLEASVPEIREYAPDGALLRRIGQRGDGPGEFNSGPRFGVVGDTVWAVDLSIGRITLFDRRGNLLSTGRTDGVLIPLPKGYGHIQPWSMRPDGRFIGNFSQVSYRSGDETDVKPTDRIPVPFVLFDASGAVTDTIGWAGRPPPRMWRPPSQLDVQYRSITVDGHRQQVPSPPTRMPWWEPTMEGYVLVQMPAPTNTDDGVLEVTHLAFSGDTLFKRVLHYRPVRYSDADLDSIAVHAGRGEPGGGVAYVPGARAPDDWKAIARALRAAMDFPGFKVPIEYPWVARDGAIWLRRTSSAVSQDAEWVVLDAQGRPRGALELPTAARPVWNGGDTLWASVPDDQGVPWLVRFRVRTE